MPLFNLDCTVSRTAIETGYSGLLGHSLAVLLSKYLLGPYETPRPETEQWVSFREFPGSAPFQQGFMDTVERRIATVRTGELAQLRQACLEAGGRETAEEFSHDLALYMPGLPRVPLLLLFNDEEEGFPAHCTVLFRPNVPVYLDMECTAIMGIALAVLVAPRDET